MNKRLYAIMLALLLLMTTLTIGAQTENLLANGDFTTGDGWQADSGITIANGAASGNGKLTQTVSVRGGDPYVLTAAVRSGQVTVELHFLQTTAQGTRRELAGYIKGTLGSAPLPFTADEKATDLLVILSLSGNAAVDDVLLCYDMTSEIAVDPETNKEFVRNGDFEMMDGDGGATGWSKNTAVSVSQDKKKDGDASLMISTEAGNLLDVTQMLTHLVAQKTYTISGDYYVAASSGAEAVIRVEFRTEDEKTVIEGKTLNIDQTADRRWKHFSYTLDAPQGTFAARLVLRVYEGGNKTIYWDNISFRGERLSSYKETPLTPTAGNSAINTENLTPKYPYTEATSREMLKNEDMTKLTERSLPTNWSFEKGTLGKEFFLETEDIHDGTNAVHMIASGESELYVTQQVAALVGLAEYKVTAWVKVNSIPQGKYPVIKFELYSSDKYLVGNEYPFREAKANGEWQEWTFKFVTPADTVRANFLIRLPVKNGDILYDAMSVRGAHAADYPQPVDMSLFPEPPVKPMVEGTAELFKNTGFETVSEAGVPENWDAYKGWDSGFAKVQQEVVHSGKNAVKIEIDESGNPWIRQELCGLTPGVEYQLSSYIRSSFFSGLGISYKFEYYKADSTGVKGAPDTYGYIKLTTGENWYHFVQHFTPPPETYKTWLYLRLYGVGHVYFDDASCYQSGAAPRFELQNDLYYTETEYGYATVIPDLSIYPTLANATVNFQLSDGESVLREQRGVAITAGHARFKYYAADLPVEQKEYTISATICDADGTALETATESVRRYNRPTMLDAAGNYIVDGEIFDPIFAYHVDTNYYPRLKEIGVNVVQGQPTKAVLDAAQENGIKVLVELYKGMLPAGHPSNAERTARLVEEFKEHPAVFGWMIMDEPFSHAPDCLPDLRNSYRIIREIDKAHPAFVTENGTMFRRAAECSDILCVDPYPAGRNTPTTYVATQGQQAADIGMAYAKPVYSLLQVFKYGNYYPSHDELRNMLYQVLFSGGKSIGYYEIDSPINGKPLFEDALWNTLMQWNEKEKADAYSFFAHQKWPTFLESRTEDAWSIAYPKDGKLRVIVLNRKDKESVSVNLPLASMDGSIQIGGYSGSVYAGADAGSFRGDGTLSVTLLPSQAVVYELTPDAAVDFSGLHTSRYLDLGTHTWARAAIERLENENIIWGISPNAYGPGKLITRGDFAAFLVKTLGLTAETSEQFSDVNTAEPYAQALAIGKACGILQGMGDGTFCPEREITRQDMMTIVARGMQLAADTDLGVFSDAASIADYALPHVKAMIAAGLIRGNADGTLNPRGNTTRAETAVIMQRILDKA